jgi:hypothetical protein
MINDFKLKKINSYRVFIYLTSDIFSGGDFQVSTFPLQKKKDSNHKLLATKV